MDSLGTKRSQMLEVFERILDSVSSSRKGNPDQISFFDDMGEEDPVMQEMFPDIIEYPSQELLMMEKEMLGLYISGHPLEEFAEELTKFTNMSTADLNVSADLEDELDIEADGALKEAAAVAFDGVFAKMAGIITTIKLKSTRNNAMMAFVELEDMYGTIEMIVFPRTLTTYGDILKVDAIVLVEGRISQKEDEGAKLLLDRIKPMIKGETADFTPKFGKKYTKPSNVLGSDASNVLGSDPKSQLGNNGSASANRTPVAEIKIPSADGKKLYVRINSEREPVAVNILTDSIKNYPGNMPVIIVDAGKIENGKPTVLAAGSGKWVSNDENLIKELIERFGIENVIIR